MKLTQHEDESESEFLLRLAAHVIATHCPTSEFYHEYYDDTIDCNHFAKDLITHVESIAADRERRGNDMIFTGTVIQAGGSGKEPTVTLTTSTRELSRCKTIPFYKSATIRITPL